MDTPSPRRRVCAPRSRAAGTPSGATGPARAPRPPRAGTPAGATRRRRRGPTRHPLHRLRLEQPQHQFRLVDREALAPRVEPGRHLVVAARRTAPRAAAPAATGARRPGPPNSSRTTASVSSPTKSSRISRGVPSNRCTGGIADASSASHACWRSPPSSRQRGHQCPSVRYSSGTTRPARAHRSTPRRRAPGSAGPPRHRRVVRDRGAGRRRPRRRQREDRDPLLLDPDGRRHVHGVVPPKRRRSTRARGSGKSGSSESGPRHSRRPVPGDQSPCSMSSIQPAAADIPDSRPPPAHTGQREGRRR